MIIGNSFILKISAGEFMKTRGFKTAIIVSFLIISGACPVKATDLIFSFPEIPVTSYYDENGEPAGYFIEMYHIFKKNYKKGELTFSGIYPFKRSLMNISQGKADIHFPIIRPPYVDLRKLQYGFLPEKMGVAHFVLYTRADDTREINKETIKDYKIEIQRGHSEYFAFKLIEGNFPEQMLRKLLKGRIDGYIGGQINTDSIIRKHKLRNLKRKLFDTFPVCFAIQKGERGIKIKKAFLEFVRDMKKNPEFIKLNEKVEKTYVDWQPYKELSD